MSFRTPVSNPVIMKTLFALILLVISYHKNVLGDSNHKEIIDQCNNESNLSDDEIKSLAEWIIPTSPRISCHLYCILKGFGWVQGRVNEFL